MKNLTSRLFLIIVIRSATTIFLLASLAPRAAHGQDLDNASVSGRVFDQNGAVIPGAVVEAIMARGSRTVVTDDEGRYLLIQLEPGKCILRISASGFARHEKRDLTIVAGQNSQLNITLYPQGLTADPVTITQTETQVVDTTKTSIGGTITPLEIESLPVATRSPLDLIFTLPGVTEEPLSTRELAEDRGTNPRDTPEEAGTLALSGGPAYSNNITIDGLDNNDDRGAGPRFQPSIEAVEEVQVITNQFSAEYGRASGGRVNIRTRGGARQFRGRAFYFFRDESLNPNPTALKTTGGGNTY